MLYKKGEQYGNTLEEIARRWSKLLKCSVSAKQVALCMAELKLVRLSHDSDNFDSILDAVSYLTLATME